MDHQPTRPFESLEWYRDAARRNFQETASGGPFATIRSLDLLRGHIGLFAIGSVVMLLVNEIRTPERIWCDRWIMAWTVLVLIHAIAIGIVWAIGQWDSDDTGEPVRMTLPNRERSAVNPWLQGDQGIQDATVGPVMPPGAGWSNWQDAPEPAPGERTSWRVAAAAAWLQQPDAAETDPNSPRKTESE